MPQTRQISVPVTTMKAVQRTATRQVVEMVPTTEMRTETYCEMVPYTEQIQVPVPAAPCPPSPCPPGYSAPYGYGVQHGMVGGCGGCGGC